MLLFYCLTVRQYITEKRAKRLRELNPNLAEGNQNDSNLFINADMQSQISGLFYSIFGQVLDIFVQCHTVAHELSKRGRRLPNRLYVPIFVFYYYISGRIIC